jgi:hypothetical protein
MIEFSIDIKILRAMSHLCGTDESRYVLMGLLVELADDIKVVATDGRRLGVYRINTKPEAKGRFVFPTYWLPWVKPPTIPTLIKVDGEKFTVYDLNNNCDITGNLIDVQYPKWDQVIPQGATSQVGQINFSTFLAEGFLKVAETLGGNSHVCIYPHGKGQQFSIHIPDHPNFYGTLMGLRNSDDPHTIPNWLQPKTQNV